MKGLDFIYWQWRSNRGFQGGGGEKEWREGQRVEFGKANNPLDMEELRGGGAGNKDCFTSLGRDGESWSSDSIRRDGEGALN